MAEFLVVPEAFVAYVKEFRRLPIPPDLDVGALRSIIETVALEAWLGEPPAASRDAATRR